jgi:alkylhydroperoxidase family enzyme
VVTDWRTAPLDPKLRAVLGFLEAMTLRPDTLGPEDAEAVRSAGVGDDALVDAIHVCALFNMITRLADSLGWDVPPPESFAARAEHMLAGGYVLPTLEDVQRA